MPFRTDVSAKVYRDGKPYTIFLVDNPTIEDVVVVEAKLIAAEFVNGAQNTDHRVSRDVREQLLRLGVER